VHWPRAEKPCHVQFSIDAATQRRRYPGLACLAIIYLFPYITKRGPSALVSIVVLPGFTIYSGIKLRTVGDMGELPSSLPFFAVPQVPLNLATSRTPRTETATPLGPFIAAAANWPIPADVSRIGA
jgi:hypothetical protein